jgi:hypothetical protein
LELFDCIRQRIDVFPERFARPHQHYLQNAMLLVLGGYSRAPSLAMCSLHDRCCGLWRACPFCCHVRTYRAFEAFLKVRPSVLSRLWFQTIAPTRLFYPDEVEERFQIEAFWDAVHDGLHQLVQEGVIEGAFAVEEYSPVLVDDDGAGACVPGQLAFPHAHLILIAERLTAADVARLRSLVGRCSGMWRPRRRRRNKRSGAAVPEAPGACSGPAGASCGVDTRTTPISRHSDLARIIRYLLKPVDWLKAYGDAWDRLGAAGRPGVAVELNRMLANAVDDWEAVTYCRHKVYRLGRLHPCHRAFVGTKKRARRSRHHRELIRRRLDECEDEPWDPEHEALVEPLEGQGACPEQ